MVVNGVNDSIRHISFSLPLTLFLLFSLFGNSFVAIPKKNEFAMRKKVSPVTVYAKIVPAARVNEQ